MKILMLPDYSRNNPYQQLLAAALQKMGVDVILCNFRVLPLLRSVWAYGRPDILHLHWTDGFIIAGSWPKTIVKTLRFLIEILVIKILRIKVIWTVHNLSNHEKLKSNYENFVVRLLIHLYDQVIVHCLSAQKAVIQTFRLSDRLISSINVIPIGHYLDCYENRVTQEEARISLGYREDAVLFLFLGIIRPYKGLLELIDAFRKVDNPQAKLLIVGNPSNDITRKELLNRCQADSRIGTRLEYVPQNEIQVYMNAADITVFPYTDILTSSSVLLAMSFGKAIVVPRIGCIPETLDAQGGLLYDPSDTGGLSNALNNILASDLGAMGRHNRIKVENFGWDKIAKMTLDVYYKSINNRK
ncbi:MAG: glycosyltransferase family 4 protein [Anaerolineales bacterium]|nr:glycosyltransferase family 4 protein [Anaerolineales bacterium]